MKDAPVPGDIPVPAEAYFDFDTKFKRSFKEVARSFFGLAFVRCKQF